MYPTAIPYENERYPDRSAAGFVHYLSLGKRIQSKRRLCGKTQENLAEAISVTVGYISQIERGKTKVNLETLSNIAEVLGCEISELLGGTTKAVPSYLCDDFSRSYEQLTSANKKILLELSEVLIKNQ